MDEYVHQYERAVVIRLRYRVDAEGGVTYRMRIDSDVRNRDELLGILFRAQQDVADAYDWQHDRLDLAALPGFDDGQDDD